MTTSGQPPALTTPRRARAPPGVGRFLPILGRSCRLHVSSCRLPRCRRPLPRAPGDSLGRGVPLPSRLCGVFPLAQRGDAAIHHGYIASSLSPRVTAGLFSQGGAPFMSLISLNPSTTVSLPLSLPTESVTYLSCSFSNHRLQHSHKDIGG